jgi:hypothetical protein
MLCRDEQTEREKKLDCPLDSYFINFYISTEADMQRLSLTLYNIAQVK